MDTLKKLGELGLSKHEAVVYVYLLKTDGSVAGPIIKSSGLHRMIVYTALDALVARGLVNVLRKKSIQFFQAADPTLLIDNAQKLNALAKEVVPELKALRKKGDDPIYVKTLLGREGLQLNLETIIASATKQSDKTMSIIGGAKDTDFYKSIGVWYPSYVRLLEKNKIKKVVVAPPNYSSEFKKKFTAEKNSKLKVLKGLSSPTYTRITAEMVSIEMYQPQIIVIQIINSVIAKAYLDSFKILWNSASEI